MVDFFNIINKNSRLRKHMNKAKQTTTVGEFDGPDGDYICLLKRFSAYEKDGVSSVIFEFRTIEDDSDYGNKKIVIFIKLDDGPLYTAEEAQELMFQYIQLMNVPTAESSQEEIEEGLSNIINNELQVIVRKRSTTKKIDGKSTTYKNYSVVGFTDELNHENAVDTEEKTNTNNEWSEVEETSTEETSTEEETYKPSDYIGYLCYYKGKEYTLAEANDDDHTVVIKDDKSKKKVKVTFDQLEWETPS